MSLHRTMRTIEQSPMGPLVKLLRFLLSLVFLIVGSALYVLYEAFRALKRSLVKH